jgi:uncharacterized protein YndB with AHSA1/START domain
MGNVFGAELRRVENRVHLGRPALVGVAIRIYDTTVEDLWEATTTPERLARWFLPVEGDLTLGGRYQLKGNAGGTITRCDPPEALDLTWEFGGGTSWVHLRLAPDGQKARLTLEHIAHKDGIGEEHLKQYGPGATGVGWDLALHGLKQHLANPRVAIDPAAFEAWTLSSEDPDEARVKAERTIAAYTGA